MPRKPWQPSHPERVVKAYLAGETLAAIAAREGSYRAAVRKFLTEQGVEIRGKGAHHELPLGSRRLTTNGYWMVKTGPGSWKTRQQAEWEKALGPVAEGCTIMRLQELRDDRIDRIDNLVQVNLKTRCLLATATGGPFRLTSLPNVRNVRLLAAAAAALSVNDLQFRAGAPPRAI